MLEVVRFIVSLCSFYAPYISNQSHDLTLPDNPVVKRYAIERNYSKPWSKEPTSS